MPGAGKYYTPPDHSHDPTEHVSTVDDIKTMRYRAGRTPTYLLRIRGVSREDEQTLRHTAADYHMSLSVFYHFLAEAMREKRLLILPRGYDIERLISEKLRDAIQEEVEKQLRAELADLGLASPFLG